LAFFCIKAKSKTCLAESAICRQTYI